jgi:tRNA pseudouridine38-40 synthase
MRRAYRLAYDGQPYYGFQRQPDVPTVEDALFDALRDLDAFAEDADAHNADNADNADNPDDDGPDRPRGYAAAGRTDAGVSARAQTVAFEAPEWLTPRALNAELPAPVRAWASTEVAPEFHATHDARERTYVYHLYAPRESTTTREGFDDGRARAALDRLAGEHDFHNLTPDETGTVREVTASAERDGDFLVVTLRASGFARQLVRRVVGLVDEVGSGDAGLSKVDRVLGSAPLDGPEGVAPAPAEALVLWEVAYPGIAFTVDADAAETAREIFGESRVTHATAARVAGSVEDALDE